MTPEGGAAVLSRDAGNPTVNTAWISLNLNNAYYGFYSMLSKVGVDYLKVRLCSLPPPSCGKASALLPVGVCGGDGGQAQHHLVSICIGMNPSIEDSERIRGFCVSASALP